MHARTLRAAAALLVVGGAISLVACAAEISDDAGATSSATATGSTEADPAAASSSGTDMRGAVPAALRGTWLVDLTQRQLRKDLARAGFGKYADAFVRAEDLGSRVTLAVTYEADTFQVAWHRRDGSWYVGWYGDAREQAGVLTVTDALSHADDSYSWRVDGDQLVLRFRSTTTPDQGGIPFEAYSRAYFTRPLISVDCTPADLDACV